MFFITTFYKKNIIFSCDKIIKQRKNWRIFSDIFQFMYNYVQIINKRTLTKRNIYIFKNMKKKIVTRVRI